MEATDLYHRLTAEGSAAPLVVLQLLVFWRRGVEDAGNHQDGGSAGVTHLVDHDGRQGHTQERQRSHGEDNADHDVDEHEEEVSDDGKACLAVDGLPLVGESVEDVGVADVLTHALLLLLAAA